MKEFVVTYKRRFIYEAETMEEAIEICKDEMINNDSFNYDIYDDSLYSAEEIKE